MENFLSTTQSRCDTALERQSLKTTLPIMEGEGPFTGPLKFSLIKKERHGKLKWSIVIWKQHAFTYTLKKLKTIEKIMKHI